MPEYLAPGVYVEEVSFRSKSIEGVSTTTTGFVGPARYGPVTLEPDVLTSVLDFERVYGDRLQLAWGTDQYHNYLWHAVRAFFEEGGKRLYVARVFRPLVGEGGDAKKAVYIPLSPEFEDDQAIPLNNLYQRDGHARSWLTKETAAVGAAVEAVKAVTLAFSAANTAVADFEEKAQTAARQVVDSADNELRTLAAAWTVKHRLAEVSDSLLNIPTPAAGAPADFKKYGNAALDALERARKAAAGHLNLPTLQTDGDVYKSVVAVKGKTDIVSDPVLAGESTAVNGAVTTATGLLTPFATTVDGLVSDAITAAKAALASSLPNTPKQQARALALDAAKEAKSRLDEVKTKLDLAADAKSKVPAQFTHNTIDTSASDLALASALDAATDAATENLAAEASIITAAGAVIAERSTAAIAVLSDAASQSNALPVVEWGEIASDLKGVGATGESVKDGDTTASLATDADTIITALSIVARAAENTRKTDKKTIQAIQAIQAAVPAKYNDALNAQGKIHQLLAATGETLDAAIFTAEPRAFTANQLVKQMSTLETKLNDLAGQAATTGSKVIEDAPKFADHTGAVLLRARFPGAAGNVQIRFTLRFGQNTLVAEQGKNSVRNLSSGDLVWIGEKAADSIVPGDLLIANPMDNGSDWHFADGAGSIKYWLNQPQPPAPAAPKLSTATQILRPVTLAVEVVFASGASLAWDGLALQPGHTRTGAEDSVTAKFRAEPTSAADAQTLPFVILTHDSVGDAITLCQTLFEKSPIKLSGSELSKSRNQLSVTHTLLGGNDGQRPAAADYEGVEEDFYKTGLRALEDIEDISIVAAPGATYGLENEKYKSNGLSIINSLISHAQNMRYRIAVLDAADNQSIAQVRDLRGRLDSKYAALYYPWIKVLDPVTRQEIHLPPSGFVAGVYARNDIQRAVWKAPANEVVNLALGFEKTLNKAQQEVLNPEGINCFRYFPGRGYRLWGARTISSDPEWKYVNLRRYFAYLEHSIDKGTQWAVFEPNGERLWDNVRRTIYDFMLNEWQNGALLGEKPEKAFFVRCDRSTMTQNDLDNGRLVCLIGLAPLRPAEFVIFRIGQWTADHKV